MGPTKYAADSSLTVNISSLLHTFDIVFVTVYVCGIVCTSVAVLYCGSFVQYSVRWDLLNSLPSAGWQSMYPVYLLLLALCVRQYVSGSVFASVAD